MTSEKLIQGYDFTIPSQFLEHKEIINFLENIADKWVFQHEEGESGFRHYQGRLHTKTKKRLNTIINQFHCRFQENKAHLSITSRNNFLTSDFGYVMKEDTRLEGPWSDKDDKPIILPRQVRNIVQLYPYQQSIIDSKSTFDTRGINMIIDPAGGKGKTTIKTIIGASKKGIVIPALKDYKDLMRLVMCQDKLGLYIIDMPRAMKKENLEQFFSAVETIKDGYAFDERYHFKSEYFDCPQIWIFTNVVPDLELLSKDRWRLYIIDSNKCLKGVLPHCIQ